MVIPYQPTNLGGKLTNNLFYYRINVITRLLKTYPDLITCDEFLLLLQALSEIQVECKNEDTRYHTYECLIALIDVQKHLNSDYLDIASVNLLWNIIWQSSLK